LSTHELDQHIWCVGSATHGSTLAQLGKFATLLGYWRVAAKLCETGMKPSNLKQHATHFLAVTGTQTSIQVIR
jgi:hypothetical protein